MRGDRGQSGSEVLTQLLLFIVVGAVAGWLAGQFMRGHGFGLVGDVIVGIIGSFIGGYVMPVAGTRLGGGIFGTLFVAFLGAVLLLFVVRLFTGRRGGRKVWS